MTNILIADDDPNYRKLLTTILNQHQYTTDTTTNGQQALQAYHHTLTLPPQHQYHAIISDLNMPQLNGLQLFHHIRQNDTHTKLYLMTTNITLPIIYATQTLDIDYIHDKTENLTKLLQALKTTH